MAFSTLHLSSRIDCANCKLCNLYNLASVESDDHYYCVACQREGSNFLPERRGCEWKAVPQLSWMDVNARNYWVCPGCARLVNRDVNREHRGMPVIGIQPISWQPTDLDRVSDDARRAISSLSEPFACIRPVANAAANFLRIFEHALRRRNQKNRTRWLRQDGNLRFGKLFVLSLCLKM